MAQKRRGYFALILKVIISNSLGQSFLLLIRPKENCYQLHALPYRIKCITSFKALI